MTNEVKVFFYILISCCIFLVFSASAFSEENVNVVHEINKSCAMNEGIVNDLKTLNKAIADKDENIDDYKKLFGEKFLIYNDLLLSYKENISAINVSLREICSKLLNYDSSNVSDVEKTSFSLKIKEVHDELKKEERRVGENWLNSLEYITNCSTLDVGKRLLTNVIPENKYDNVLGVKGMESNPVGVFIGCGKIYDMLFEGYEIVWLSRSE